MSARRSLDDLRAADPGLWDSVQAELAALPDGDALRRYVAALGARRAGSDAGRQALRQEMAVAVIRAQGVAAASGVSSGRVRFGLVNGFVAQRLLFRRGLERKPVSMLWFRLLWPLLWQRRRLLPLVQPKGIYCFYSRPLVRALAELIGNAPCLEIAAGDGTLTRFLAARGVAVGATDDHSWSHAVTFGADVERRDAVDALRIHAPRVVICSWPPAGNTFERQVFRTRSVELYVMIGSRHEWAAGNWDAYREQSAFTWVQDEALSRLVLPPELEAAVYVFRRRSDG